MFASRITKGDTIGIFSPSHTATPERYARALEVIEHLGYKVKFGENLYKDTYIYAASSKERADDLNALVADPDVKMILFSGGDSAAEILPFIDYELIRKNPKLFSSYSDATPILNAIRAMTGLVTYYGFGLGEFRDLRYYDYMQFCQHFVDGCYSDKFVTDSNWTTLAGGSCEGIILGGYSSLVALMLNNKYFSYDPNAKYLLVIEDHEHFSQVGSVASYLSFIEQSEFMSTVSGLIFGHFSEDVPPELLSLLARFGERHKVPVVYTDDFGHGTKHAIFPLGASARLDADAQMLTFL